MYWKFPLIYTRRGKNISKAAEIYEMHKRYSGSTKKRYTKYLEICNFSWDYQKY